MKTCRNCSAPAVTPCPTCEKYLYCSPEHAKKHTKAHKRECYPVERVGDPVRPQLEATKRIPMGNKILKEVPIFIGPGSYDYFYKYHTKPKAPVRPICLGCYQFLDHSSTSVCSTCKWPMHTDCQDEPWHKNFECSRLANRLPFSTKEGTQYYHISILRLLLLPKLLPSAWEKLEARVKVHGLEIKEELGVEQMEKLTYSVQVRFGLTEKIDENLVGALYKTIQLNGIYSVMPEDVCCTCIFERMSEIGHSCMPNTRYTMLPYKEGQPFQILLYAAMDINPGTILTRTLTADITMLETYVRREKLRVICGITCKCLRCMDPLEFNTLTSAVYCTQPSCQFRGGCYLLPQESEKLSLKSLWRCVKCLHEETYESIQTHVDNQIKRILSIKVIVPWRRDEDQNEYPGDREVKSYELLLSGIEKVLALSEVIVHRNHYILWPLKNAYMGLISEALEVMDLELKFRFSWKLISMARTSLTVALLLSPGISPLTGSLLYYMAKGLEGLIQSSAHLPSPEENKSIRPILERLYADSAAILSLIKNFPEPHGIREANDMIREMQTGLDDLKYDGISRLFKIPTTTF